MSEEAETPEIPPPTVHSAELGGMGSVLKGERLTEAEAVERRRRGLDVVVCGESLRENRRLAGRIEDAVDRSIRHEPHIVHAGSDALPHHQQKQPPPIGHTFYETPRRRARSK